MPLAAAGIAAGGSLLGGIVGGKGAEKAAKAQAAAQQAAINEQHSEFSTIQANEAPYMSAGTTGLSSYLNLLGQGSGGLQGQQSAIDALKASPQYTSEFGSGLDALNQSLAASGGLRGGNGALDQSNFGSSLLSSLIQQQLGQYYGLAGLGQSAASASNAGAASTGSAISSLLTQQGNSAASGILGGANSFENSLNSLSGIAGKYLGGGYGLTGGGFSPTNYGLPSSFSPATSDPYGISTSSGYTGYTGKF